MQQAARCFASVACAILVWVPAAASAQGTDELWQITTKVEMPGMPMAMPEQMQTVCLPRGHQGEAERVPKDKNCRMTDVKQSGNQMTFTIVCEGKDRMTGTGDIVSTPDSYRGSMRLQGTMEGQPVSMTQAFSGRRTGTCTYEAPEKRVQQQMAATCQQGLDQLASAMFVGDQAICKDRREAFCGRVSGLAQEMREPARYQETVSRRGDWRQLLGACGQDAQAVTRDACSRAIGGKSWDFAVRYCEEEAKAVARQQCEGRTYTAALSAEYGPLCQRYAARPGREYTASPAIRATTPAPPAATAPPPPTATDVLKEGTQKLRKFLGF
ncbi:MAG: DUF3617 domain-containing protein [candidate division NC10 bacterium]|nr:DUF3617 domain-containing protein [candidate division NC10 bacterium]